MAAEGYEIIAIEDYRWPDGHTESEILSAKEEQPMTEDELPFQAAPACRVRKGPAERLYPAGGQLVPQAATLPAMNIALRKPRMTREAFFDWAQTQDVRYEFDGFEPVAMTGGNRNHSRITQNIQFALRTRLRGGPCEPLGPDAGVATIGDAVRYPDALVTCTRGPGTDRVIPGVVVVFEVISPTSGRTDRIVKVREYAVVASILRYVILEHTNIGLTVLQRSAGDQPWTVTTLTADDTLRMPEIGIEIPVTELYEDTDLPDASREDSAPADSPAPG